MKQTIGSPLKLNEFDEDDLGSSKGELPFCVNSTVSNEIIIPIDEVVQEASYYRNVAHAVSSATGDDVVKYRINSPGGRLDGLIALLHATVGTQATVVAEIVGECHSAASILALHCDEILVGPYASMLCHSVRYGYVGKGADVEAHVKHASKTTEKLMRETYTGFLSEEEIEDLLKGRELYLDASEIIERLKAREEFFNRLENDLD